MTLVAASYYHFHRGRSRSLLSLIWAGCLCLGLTGAAMLHPKEALAAACAPIPGVTYDVQPVDPPPVDRPAEAHPDFNLALRSYRLTVTSLGLIDYLGNQDVRAPQLYGLFADQRTPDFTAAYQVGDWDWGCNCSGKALTEPDVTLIGMTVTADEVLHVPDSGYTIGDGHEVLVLYASAERITLHYGRQDSVARGYTVHMENVCVDPNLVTLYTTSNEAGRAQLPALRPGQPFARARGIEVIVAIRDNGSFLDPRSRKDWWRGR
jgi:hypothetical protein